MNIRTDLIAEEYCGRENIEGILCEEEVFDGGKINTTTVKTELAAERIGKPMGTYCTVSFDRLDRVSNTDAITDAVIKCLETLLPKNPDNILIVGLGNTDITPDALGPFVADGVLATRHLSKEFKKALGLDKLKSVSCIIPGVLGKTGIEAFDIISAAVERAKPSVIIAIDALAAREPERLCRTVQLSDSGICPGSGVNNSRKEISQKTFSLPVIAIGVPTVIDAGHLFDKGEENMMVTPKDIDLLTEKVAYIISRALNIFLQPDLDRKIIESLT